MSKIEKLIVIVISVIITAAIIILLAFQLTPNGKRIWNNWFHMVQVADDETNYDTIKKVEDTCRSMISSYNADKITYEQYKDSEDSDKQAWAEQAKIRANRTAATYNEYILKNNYVWKDNVPSDILTRIPYLE